MRHGRGVVLAAVLLTGLTGCADRPNDLETYYDTQSSAPPTTKPAPASVRPSPAAPDPDASVQSAVAGQVADAVLTKDDLVHEGVRAAGTRIDNGECFAAVPAGDPRGAGWTYPSGASLLQQVTGYLDRTASEVLTGVQCAGQPLTVALPSGAESVRAWCQGTTCTVLLAGGHVLSGLQVTASSAARAVDAVKSLAALAAKKLPVQP